MLRQEIILAIYCIIDDLLRESGHKFDTRCKVTDSQVLTTGLVAALYFGGIFHHASQFLSSFEVFSAHLSKSRLCRRLHRLEPLIEELIQIMGQVFIQIASDKTFIVDSTPFAVCDNIRIKRCKLLCGEEFRGYHASFKKYFYGFKLQLLVNAEGIPVRYVITEGSLHDALGMRELELDVSPEAEILADAAYENSSFEKLLKQKGIRWLTDKRCNSRNPHPAQLRKRIKRIRKKIETVFSSLKSQCKRHINAVSWNGYILKIKYFIAALQFKKILC